MASKTTLPTSQRIDGAVPVSELLGPFFFFKQQTAYEITYGDWSSDVCSSDLLDRQPTDLSGAWHHTGDVSSEADVAGFAAAVHDRFGQVDVLVNNAGIAYI